jgi:hypothetical protein
MSAFIESLEQYRLTSADLTALASDFTIALSGSNLERSLHVDALLARYRKVPGTYFWVMRVDGAQYSIYVGQTNSIAARVKNYVDAFQPDSPNDFELQIFHSFMIELAPAAPLDLHLCPLGASTTTKELRSAERSAYTKYQPLLNFLEKPTADAKAALSLAFAAYFKSKVVLTLSGGTVQAILRQDLRG